MLHIALILTTEGVGAPLADIDVYLTQTGPFFGPWEEQDAVRRRLAEAGPSIVLPTLRATVRKLQSFGTALDSPFAGTYAEAGIRLAFDRATDLLIDIIRISTEEEPQLGGWIARNAAEAAEAESAWRRRHAALTR
jgi:hypothetical protein